MDHDEGFDRTLDPSILPVNRQMCVEATETIYGGLTFTVDLERMKADGSSGKSPNH